MTSSLLMSVSELAGRLNDADVRVFDVRHDLGDFTAGRRQFEASHIAGAHFLDNEKELAGEHTGRNGRHPLPDRGALAKLFEAHGVGPDTLVVAYDASGGQFAAHLWWLLRWVGHDRAAVLDGGWQAWNAAGLPVESGGPPAAAAAANTAAVSTAAASTAAASTTAASAGSAATAAPRAALVEAVDADAVLANLRDPSFTLVDARAAARYRGEVEPIDPEAGRIPGALNRPYTDNLDADGRFKSPAQLRQEFQAVLGDRAPSSIVHQCGSGITASANLFAMELAGLTGSRLYPGSWSEWISDPSRPREKG